MADLNRRVEVLVGVFTLLGAAGFASAIALSLWGDELQPRVGYELVLESGAGLAAGTPVTQPLAG